MFWNEPGAGPTLATAPGLASRGGASPIPNLAMPGTNWLPSWSPIWPNVVLHDTVKLSMSVPPQVSPPKFFSVAEVWGSGSWLRSG